MGKRVLDAIYLKLGKTEMDDMAEGIKALWTRPYFDKDRVGIYGTSYGGYTSAMMILRHPEVVAAASASSPPTAWYNYDTIYTERYMWIPQENKEGYEAGNDANFAKDLQGPAAALLRHGRQQRASEQLDAAHHARCSRPARASRCRSGPTRATAASTSGRMMEFFIENLVMHPERLMAPAKAGG